MSKYIIKVYEKTINPKKLFHAILFILFSVQFINFANSAANGEFDPKVDLTVTDFVISPAVTPPKISDELSSNPRLSEIVPNNTSLESPAPNAVVTNSPNTDIPNSRSISSVAVVTDSDVETLAFGSQWIPKGGVNLPVSKTCQPAYLEEQLIQAVDSNRLNILKAYFERCERSLSRFTSKGLSALLKFQDLKYDIFDSSAVETLNIRFSDGHTISGFVAMKPDNQQRPLVIVKCGLLCEGKVSSSTQILMSQLFDEAPFNLVLLASHSGLNIVKENQRIAIGGWLEGQEMIATARWLLEDSKFKSKISSIHGVGMSLGGAAALYAAVYNDHTSQKIIGSNDEKEGEASKTPLFRSITAACPVVNLKPTLTFLFEKSDSNLRSVVSDKIWNVIKKAYSSVPDLHPIVDLNDRPRTSEFTSIIGQAGTNFFVRQEFQPQLPPLKGDARIAKIADYWHANNFLRHFRGLKTPTLVWGSKDDMMVKNSDNTAALASAATSDSPGLRIINTNGGNHCLMPLTYGWGTSSAILRSFIITHSPEMLERRNKLKIPFSPRIELEKKAKHVGQIWQATKGADQLKVSFWTYKSASFCRQGSFKSPKNCYKKQTAALSLSELPSYLAIQTPNSRTAAEVLSRWANANLRIFSDNDEPLIDTKSGPSHIEFVSYLPDN